MCKRWMKHTLNPHGQHLELSKLVEVSSKLKASLTDIQTIIASSDDALRKYTIWELRHMYKCSNTSYPATRINEQIRLLNDRGNILAALSVAESRLSRIQNTTSGGRFIRAESGAMGDVADGAVSSSVVDVEQNFTDAAGATAQEVAVGDSAYPETGQRNLISLSQFLSRPVRIASESLPMSSNIILKFKVWDLFTLDPSVRAKFRNFAYFQGNLKIRINISGSPFHMGRVLLSYQPYADSNANLTSLEAELSTYANLHTMLNSYLSQSPGAVVMDVKDNQPLEIDIPFIAPKPMYSLMSNTGTVASASSYPELEEAGTLYVTSLNHIRSVSSTPSTVEMTMYAWCEDVQLGTLTSTKTEIVTESGEMKDERETGPVQKVSTAIANVSAFLSSYPPIAPFARASFMASSALKELSAHFGWSKPLMNESSQLVKNVAFRNGAQTLGYDTNYKLSLDPKQELLVDPRIAGSDRDDMVMANIASKESYLTSFGWTDTDAPDGSPIFTVFVTPNISTIVDTVAYTAVQPTACAFAVTPFKYWRCTMVYRIEVVCSAFHRGKIAVMYEPNSAAYSVLGGEHALNKRFTQVIDIQETQSFEFCIEWALDRPWQAITKDKLYYEYADTAQVISTADSNGFFTVIPFTTLQSPDSSPVEVNVYVHAKDLHVNFLTSANLPVSRIFTESGEMTAPNPSSLVNVPATCFVLNKSSANTNHLSENYFGEEPLSFRALLKRYCKETSISAPAMVASTPSILFLTRPRFSVNTLPYGSAGNISNLFTYLRYAYLGYRGSTRKRIMFSGNAFTSATAGVKVSNSSVRSYDIDNVGVYALPSAFSGSMLEGTVTMVPDSNGGIEVDLPFYSVNLFNLSIADDPTGPTSFSATFLRDFTYAYDGIDFAASEVQEDIASGEDFSFFRFQGAPSHTF